MPTCFFIGHREAPDSLLPQLSVEIERHITEYGVTDFVVGRYGHFDALVAKYDRPIPPPPGFDGTFYPPGMETVPKRAAIIRANRYMVEHSEYLIAYAWHPASNAWDLVEYAQRSKSQTHIRIAILSRQI